MKNIVEILVRRDMPLDELEGCLQCYCELLQCGPSLDLRLAEGALRIVQVGQMLLVGASPALAPAVVRADAVYLVQDIESFIPRLSRQGAEWLQPLAPIVTGKNMVVRHPDGLVVEYVEHLESQGAA
jgi:hypothetical protein